jgi:pimeloyl-ACP methyl ester carboxylesterase
MNTGKHVSLGDVSLFVEEHGRGTPLLLVHGFPLDHSMWQPQFAGLADSCHLIAPDLRGFGKSTVTAGVVPMEQFADDLARLLDALGVHQPVVFCGLSMGGYIGWQFLQRHARRLRGLILCDTRAIADTPEAAANRRVMAERVEAEGSAFLADSMLPKLFGERAKEALPHVIKSTQEVMLHNNRGGIAAALRGMADRPDSTSLLPHIKCPTLVVCGSEDLISPAKEMRGIAAAIPQATYVEIPNSGHMSPLEDAAAVNAAIRDFLGQLR